MTGTRGALIGFGLLFLAAGAHFAGIGGEKSAAAAPVAAAVESRASTPEAKAQPVKLVVYYFHTTARCYTCRLIENYSAETVQQRFAGEIGNGRIEWRTVNVQESANRHFVKKYQLFTKTVVVVRLENGKEVKHKALNDTWNLVDRKPAFQSYIEREVRGMLQGG
jgi:hypothetical protein